ncbi:MAG: hypothetical protein J7527_01680 [Chitinophagaceae bacterium]|nr:hypothetical protein [Chitinophagaceae bacterium]
MNLYTYIPEKHCLRQKPTISEPLIKDSDFMSIEGKSKWAEDWQNYEDHVAALPSYACAPGTVWENRDYQEGEFEVREVKTGFETETFISKIAYPRFCQECNGDGYVTNGEHPSSEDYRDYTCEACMGSGWLKQKEPPPTFTLKDMIECWEAGQKYGADEWMSTERGMSVEEPDKKQYFKSKGIDLS